MAEVTKRDWTVLIPDTRTVVVVGMFALAWRALEMVDAEPKLLDNAAFMTLATLIIGGSGLGAAVGFFFNSSKGSSEKDQTIAALSQNQPTPLPLPQSPPKQDPTP